jgi:phage major head subunit gpT-like protein
MAAPHISTSFGDLLDPRFQEIFTNAYDQLPDMIPTLFSMPGSNGRDTMRWSAVGAIADFNEFNGTVTYGSQSQGYDTVATFKEYANGVQVERKLFDDDQYNIMDQRPAALAESASRTKQKHGARIFTQAFNVDTTFYNNSEAVAMCSNSHTTTTGASTASGFDNLTTDALSATAVAAARIQMVGFRGDQAERISVMPDELWFPPDLYEEAFEIINAGGKLDTANNNPNVHQQQYVGHEWNYMDDVNNWFLGDSSYRKRQLHWVDRIAIEFAMIEDFDTLVAKWRGYQRYAYAHTDWRWVCGAQVS